MISEDGIRKPILLEPEYRDYVWGGKRLKPPEEPIAEMWAVYEQDRIATGPLAGKTLGEAAQEFGEALLGSRPFRQTGPRFPLLIKLLDCARWLSVQVHPNDEQAARLEGAGMFGKTEAWYIIEADPGAELLAGFKPGLDAAELEAAVRGGTIVERMEAHKVKAGDTVFIQPGTVHALGPGLLVYEVQQTSDITYRVFDWNRPATEGRKLHIEQSLEVIDPQASGTPKELPVPPGECDRLIANRYFSLEHLQLDGRTVRLDTQGESFHCLTCIEGTAGLAGDGWEQAVSRFQSVVVPAAVGGYTLRAEGSGQVLKSAA